jgi:hypothetical protein
MKLATIALASAFALSSTVALAYRPPHHMSGARTHHGMSSAGTHRGSMNSYGRSGRTGSPNNRGGLVGGADPGTYKP